MNAESINIDDSSAAVVRTNKSPDSIKLTFRVPNAGTIIMKEGYLLDMSVLVLAWA